MNARLKNALLGAAIVVSWVGAARFGAWLSMRAQEEPAVHGFAGVITPASGGEVTSIGDINTQSTINGPWIQSLTIPSTSYAFGEVNVTDIGGVVPAFPADLFSNVIRVHASADTTSHTQHTGAAAIENNAVHTAGSNPLTVTAIEVDATVSGAAATSNDVLEALRVFHGDIVSDTGNITLNGTSANIFATGSSSFIATLGTFFAEGSGNAIDVTGTPTAALKIRQQNSTVDLNNASASTVTLQNLGAGTFAGLKLSGAASTATTIWVSPLAPTSVNHGSLGTGSTNTDGNITSIGSNTSVVITPSITSAHMWCTVSPTSAQILAAPVGTTSVTVSCFSATTGSAANCVDMVYHCLYQ